MYIAKPLFYAVALASLALPACIGTPADVDERVGSAEQKALTFNALTFNALTFNALTFNALTFNALTFNALTFNALTFNSLTHQALHDPLAREVLTYVVGCALPASSHFTLEIDGASYSYSGQLGLAPEWGLPGGHCDGKCQEWVSACVISRLDYLGQQEQISDRGDNPGLQTSQSERNTFTSREATYYGNIFASPQRIYACLPPGKTEIPRVCGPSITNCGVDVVGQCADLCDAPRPDGSYPNCRLPAEHGSHGGGSCHQPVQESFDSITVFDKP